MTEVKKLSVVAAQKQLKNQRRSSISEIIIGLFTKKSQENKKIIKQNKKLIYTIITPNVIKRRRSFCGINSDNKTINKYEKLFFDDTQLMNNISKEKNDDIKINVEQHKLQYFKNNVDGILFNPKSPRGPKKKVRFTDNKNMRRLSTWHHQNSPKTVSNKLRKVNIKSRTKEGSFFTTNMDDPKDFGPYYNPNPGYFGDHDYDYDSSDSEYCEECVCKIL